jgi:hypothetical protein
VAMTPLPLTMPGLPCLLLFLGKWPFGIQQGGVRISSWASFHSPLRRVGRPGSWTTTMHPPCPQRFLLGSGRSMVWRRATMSRRKIFSARWRRWPTRWRRRFLILEGQGILVTSLWLTWNKMSLHSKVDDKERASTCSGMRGSATR